MDAPVILVVDDEEDLLQLMSAAINVAFPAYVVRTVSSAAEALAALDAISASGERLALAVVDHVLDGSSGLDLIRAVRERHEGARVLMYTGRATPGVEAEATAAGARVLWKPMRLKALLGEVGAAIA
jgi:DNA-binding response OmpR family regulator